MPSPLPFACVRSITHGTVGHFNQPGQRQLQASQLPNFSSGTISPSNQGQSTGANSGPGQTFFKALSDFTLYNRRPTSDANVKKATLQGNRRELQRNLSFRTLRTPDLRAVVNADPADANVGLNKNPQATNNLEVSKGFAQLELHVRDAMHGVMKDATEQGLTRWGSPPSHQLVDAARAVCSYIETLNEGHDAREIYPGMLGLYEHESGDAFSVGLSGAGDKDKPLKARETIASRLSQDSSHIRHPNQRTVASFEKVVTANSVGVGVPRTNTNCGITQARHTAHVHQAPLAKQDSMQREHLPTASGLELISNAFDGTDWASLRPNIQKLSIRTPTGIEKCTLSNTTQLAIKNALTLIDDNPFSLEQSDVAKLKTRVLSDIAAIPEACDPCKQDAKDRKRVLSTFANEQSGQSSQGPSAKRQRTHYQPQAQSSDRPKGMDQYDQRYYLDSDGRVFYKDSSDQPYYKEVVNGPPTGPHHQPGSIEILTDRRGREVEILHDGNTYFLSGRDHRNNQRYLDRSQTGDAFRFPHTSDLNNISTINSTTKLYFDQSMQLEYFVEHGQNIYLDRNGKTFAKVTNRHNNQVTYVRPSDHRDTLHLDRTSGETFYLEGRTRSDQRKFSARIGNTDTFTLRSQYPQDMSPSNRIYYDRHERFEYAEDRNGSRTYYDSKGQDFYIERDRDGHKRYVDDNRQELTFDRYGVTRIADSRRSHHSY